MIHLTETDWKIVNEYENRNGRMCYANNKTENLILQSILIGHERRKQAEEKERHLDLFAIPQYSQLCKKK